MAGIARESPRLDQQRFNPFALHNPSGEIKDSRPRLFPVCSPFVRARPRLFAQLGTIGWPNGVDFCPDMLYGWATGQSVHRPESETVVS